MKLYKFFTQTCGNCKVLSPTIEKIVKDYNLEFEDIDCTEEVPDSWAQEVRSVPTVIIIDKSFCNTKISGVHNYKYYADILDNILK